VTKLKPKVYCKCGSKLELGDDQKLMCPVYFETIDKPVSFLKLKHDTKTWGVSKDLIEYESYLELMDTIKKES
jgi:hypothetical protein